MVAIMFYLSPHKNESNSVSFIEPSNNNIRIGGLIPARSCKINKTISTLSDSRHTQRDVVNKVHRPPGSFHLSNDISAITYFTFEPWKQ